MQVRLLCALARANRDFGTDEKRIRTKITVMDKNKSGLRLLLSKIADCARTAFRPRAIGDPRGRVAVRASLVAIDRCNRAVYATGFGANK